jgi:hypothetical protein
LAETSTDDIAGQNLKTLVVVGPDGGTAVNAKAAVPPAEHLFNDGIIDLALGLEHFEHFISKQRLQIFWLRIGPSWILFADNVVPKLAMFASRGDYVCGLLQVVIPSNG